MPSPAVPAASAPSPPSPLALEWRCAGARVVAVLAVLRAVALAGGAPCSGSWCASGGGLPARPAGGLAAPTLSVLADLGSALLGACACMACAAAVCRASLRFPCASAPSCPQSPVSPVPCAPGFPTLLFHSSGLPTPLPRSSGLPYPLSPPACLSAPCLLPRLLLACLDAFTSSCAGAGAAAAFLVVLLLCGVLLVLSCPLVVFPGRRCAACG